MSIKSLDESNESKSLDSVELNHINTAMLYDVLLNCVLIYIALAIITIVLRV